MKTEETSAAKTILLVDDELAIVETLSEVLAWEGFRVAMASNGKEGLAQLSRARPDLVLVDYMMPIVDGVQMIRAMKEDPDLARIPIVMMTAAPMAVPEDIRRSIPLLVKPFGIAPLQRAIQSALAARKAP
jgi:CheY-like chemotaxis protein